MGWAGGCGNKVSVRQHWDLGVMKGITDKSKEEQREAELMAIEGSMGTVLSVVSPLCQSPNSPMEGTGKIFGLWEVRVLPRSLAYVRFFLTLAQPFCSLPFYHRQVDTGHSLSPEFMHEP